MGTVDSITERGWARLPTTTTRSSNCAVITMSSVVVSDAAIATPRRTSLTKPGSVNVTSYVAGGSAGKANRPVASETTLRTEAAPVVSRASTVTPGRARPVASATLPDSIPSWPADSPLAGTGSSPQTKKLRPSSPR